MVHFLFDKEHLWWKLRFEEKNDWKEKQTSFDNTTVRGKGIEYKALLFELSVEFNELHSGLVNN